MGLAAYLCVSAALFVIGLCCMLARKGSLHALMGLVMILNAASLNFVAFARFQSEPQDGRVSALFVLVVGALEVVLALAIFAQAKQVERS